MIEVNEAAFAALTGKISRERGFHCAGYKDKCLLRRIAVRMRAKSTFTFAEYSALLDEDPQEYEQLMHGLTINVTRFFRNWDTWNVIARKVIPEIWSQPADSISVWSAGCSSGEEAYSIAILFREHAEKLGKQHRVGRVRILGTDVDGDSLGRADAGLFGDASFVDAPPSLREKYFHRVGKQRRVRADIRRMVDFARADLLEQQTATGEHHLILCRNVIIYFEREPQDRVLELFRDSLWPNGFLVLGKAETLLGEQRTWFTPVSSRERIFRKR
jgi:Methylase of chemotaxis methyl-accepting proteins